MAAAAAATPHSLLCRLCLYEACWRRLRPCHRVAEAVIIEVIEGVIIKAVVVASVEVGGVAKLGVT